MMFGVFPQLLYYAQRKAADTLSFQHYNRYQMFVLGREVTCRMFSVLEFSPYSERIEQLCPVDVPELADLLPGTAAWKYIMELPAAW